MQDDIIRVEFYNTEKKYKMIEVAVFIISSKISEICNKRKRKIWKISKIFLALAWVAEKFSAQLRED